MAFAPGSILFIHLENFVTYERLDFHPGPNMNIIIGPNGSGKSSIVAAIALGLGFSPQILGRSSLLGSYVKKGKEKALIEIHLSACAAPVVTIRREFVSSCGFIRSSPDKWFINDEKATKESVLSLVSSFNIHLQNLCQFLPQDRLAEFSRLSPAELLIATQEAVEDSSCISLQKELIAKGGELRQQISIVESMRHELDSLVKLNDALLPSVIKYKENESQLAHIKLMMSKRPWLQYNEARAKFLFQKADRDQLEKAVLAIEAELHPIRQERKELFGQLESMDTEKTQIQQELDRSEKSRIALLGRLSANSVETAQQRLTAVTEQIQSQKMRIDELRRDLAATISETENHKKIDELQCSLHQIGLEMTQAYDRKRGYQRELEDLMHRHADIEQEGTELQRRINAAAAKSSQEKEVRHSRLDMIRQIDPDTFQAIEWFWKNSHIFKGRASEPICLVLHIKDGRYAAIVEAALSKQAMLSFVFEDEGDYETFLAALHDQMHLRVNVILMRLATLNLDLYQPLIPKEELTSPPFNFDGYLKDLLDAPELVLAALCDQFKVHLQPIALNPIGDHHHIDSNPKIVKYFVGSTGYEIKHVGGTQGSSLVISRPIRQARIFKDPSNRVSLEQQAAIIQQCRQNERTIRELVAGEAKIKSMMEGAQGTYRLLLTKREELQTEIETVRSHTKIKELRAAELARLEGDAEAAAKRLTEAKKSLQNVHYTTAQTYKQLGDVIQEQVSFLFKLANLTLTRAKIEHRIKEQEELALEKETELTKRQISLEDAEHRLNEARSLAKELLAAAKRIPLTDELKVQFEALPETLEELDAAIADAEALAALNSTVSKKVVEEWDKRAATIEELKSKEEEVGNSLKTLRQLLSNMEQSWVSRIEPMVSLINERFCTSFKAINCEGQVLLQRADNHHYERWGINIMVKFRAEEKFSILDAERQSGGERSVSTILYLMALQQKATSPFRIVDEINQGMDPRNERLVHRLIIDAVAPSEEHGSSQYFMITPKLLLDLSYAEHVSVVCIMNGPGLTSYLLRAGMDINSLSESDKRQMVALIEEKQAKQFLSLFGYVVDTCFADCVSDFTSKSLTDKEVCLVFSLRHGHRAYHEYFDETEINRDCSFSISEEALRAFFSGTHKPPYDPSNPFSGLYNNLLFTPIMYSVEFPPFRRPSDKFQIDPSKNECYAGQLTDAGFECAFKLGKRFSELVSIPENYHHSQLYIRVTLVKRTIETCLAFLEGLNHTQNMLMMEPSSSSSYRIHFKAHSEQEEDIDEPDELSIPWKYAKIMERPILDIIASSLTILESVLLPLSSSTHSHLPPQFVKKLYQFIETKHSLHLLQIHKEVLPCLNALFERLTYGTRPTELQRVLGISNEGLTSVTRAIYDAFFKVNSLPLVKTNHNCPRHSSPSTITTTPMDHHIVASYTFKQAYRKLRSLILGENGITHSILFGHDSWISPFLYFFDGINYGEWVPFCANLLIVSWDFDGELYVSFQYNLESHLRLKGIPPTIVKDGINYYSIPWLDELFLYNCTCSYSIQ